MSVFHCGLFRCWFVFIHVLMFFHGEHRNWNTDHLCARVGLDNPPVPERPQNKCGSYASCFTGSCPLSFSELCRQFTGKSLDTSYQPSCQRAFSSPTQIFQSINPSWTRADTNPEIPWMQLESSSPTLGSSTL